MSFPIKVPNSSSYLLHADVLYIILNTVILSWRLVVVIPLCKSTKIVGKGTLVDIDRVIVGKTFQIADYLSSPSIT